MNQETLYTSDIVVPITAAPIASGAIHVKDGQIVAVGLAKDLRAAAPAAEVVDFGQAILMPPLVNAHTHLELTDYPLWAKAAENLPEADGFVDWILQLIQIKHALEPEQLLRSVEHGLESMLKTGTGAICDVLSVANLDRCYQDSPLFGWLCYELIGQDMGVGAVLPMMANDWLQEGKLSSLQRGLSPHAPYTVGPETLQKLAKMARSSQVLATMHVAESSEETAFLKDATGTIANKLYPAVGWQPPAPLSIDSLDYLEITEALSSGNLLVHGVQFDADAIGKIASSGSTVVLCPRSNAKLEVGRAPVESYLCQGVNLALGTDSMASNDSISLWDEMAFAREHYGSALTSIQLLAMATINGARALQVEDKLGSFEPGTAASFQVLKPRQLPDVAEVADFLCQAERGGEVVHLYLDNTDVLPLCDKVEA
jgi:cytosine/adenosine deaminase-related metal-dependent hydrolase